MFKRITQNDEVVKAIFDHIRNLGIAGLTFTAGLWVWDHPSTGWFHWLGRISSSALMLLGVILFAIVVLNGRYKLEQAKTSRFWEFIAVMLHAFTAVYLFAMGAIQASSK